MMAAGSQILTICLYRGESVEEKQPQSSFVSEYLNRISGCCSVRLNADRFITDSVALGCVTFDRSIG